ncbi:hypothetical protein [Lactiplantibacillus plantarum]|uniref:hypothetical protein n=1 Tax=Lactiplantibacillus plantarum TaxID=1590 RepID=UPI003B9EBE48
MEQAAFIKKYHNITRQHTDSLKWDALQARYGNPDLLAMWVADMENSKCQNKLRKHYKERVAHGIYGYSITPDRYYQSLYRLGTGTPWS